MRKFLVTVLLVVCLSIRDIELAQSSVEIVQSTHRSCTPGKRHLPEVPCQTHLPEVHSRKRRYIIFEKGATLSLAVSSVKAILQSIPRGLNMISEESVQYELPSSVTIPKEEPAQPKSTKPPKPTKSPDSTKAPNSPKSPNFTKSPAPLSHVEHGGKLVHMPSSYYSSYSYPYSYPHYPYILYKRDVDSADGTEKIDGSIFDSKDIAELFFQQLNQFSENYGYNGRHCIMRIICEAQHYLYPKGESLFHDIIRIILKFSLPVIKTNKTYFTASKVENPRDCANFYGPHCRISFLEYFTVQIHGKFM